MNGRNVAQSLKSQFLRAFFLSALPIVVSLISACMIFVHLNSRESAERLFSSYGLILSQQLRRPISQGGLFTAGMILEQAQMPSDIVRAEILDPDGKQILSVANKDSTCKTTISRSFPLESDPTEIRQIAYKNLGAIRLHQQNCDSQRSIYNLMLLGGLLLIISCASFFWLSTILCNRVVRKLEQVIAENAAQGILLPHLLDSAPEEIRPLFKKLADLQETATRQSVMSGLSSQAIQVAHDIRSPITALRTVTALLPMIPNDHRNLLVSAIGRIEGIANDLLSTYRIHNRKESTPFDVRKSHNRESVVPKPFGSCKTTNNSNCDIISLVENLVTQKRYEMLGNNIKGKITLKMKFSEGRELQSLNTDAGKLERVLSNLINNALESYDHDSESNEVLVLLEDRRSELRFAIVDTGIGLTPDQMNALQSDATSAPLGFFRPQGTGLGLTYTKQFVSLAGGRFGIYPNQPKGTIVEFVLPLDLGKPYLVNPLLNN